MIHNSSINYTTYLRGIFCDKCGKFVTHECNIDLHGITWVATYYCENRSCQMGHPNCNCEYTKSRRDTQPPIMNKYEFKREMKEIDKAEGFTKR